MSLEMNSKKFEGGNLFARRNEIRLFITSFCVAVSVQLDAQITSDSTGVDKREPFAWGDFTWVQGNNRQHGSLLDSKYFTGSITIDMNYNYSFNHPIDHTNSGSTATFRSDEFNI